MSAGLVPLFSETVDFSLPYTTITPVPGAGKLVVLFCVARELTETGFQWNISTIPSDFDPANTIFFGSVNPDAVSSLDQFLYYLTSENTNSQFEVTEGQPLYINLQGLDPTVGSMKLDIFGYIAAS